MTEVLYGLVQKFWVRWCIIITTILDFDRFEVSKNQIFHNSSRKPQMVRFGLLTLRPA